ncbi:MAG: class I tRNA ligase family protein, partial [Marinibacterium sp.]|nr:class I tRNA ligase family protein [Marinibacterium sp.]
DDLPGWDSPWGRGRPGWHIECSAMSYELLGESFDIHGGGNDLTFPHHENEIAQSCCAHPQGEFARVWMHNEMLQVEGKKMSKSLGNFFTVRDLLDQGHPGEVIRFVMLSTHYRKPMDWTAAKAEEARRVLARWRAQIAGVTPGAATPELLAALADDLNTPRAIAELHRLSSAGDAPALAGSAQMLGLLEDALGGWATAPEVDLSGLADQLAGLREAAMQSKDFAPVDALKARLVEAGIEVRMSKAGVELIAGPGFDADRLEGLL